MPLCCANFYNCDFMKHWFHLLLVFAGVTPFVFNGNNSMSVTPGTTNKNKFDLKASLSRPLTYKPHKGLSTLRQIYNVMPGTIVSGTPFLDLILYLLAIHCHL